MAEDILINSFEIEKSYFATLKIFTARNVKDISEQHMEFFKQLDVDQDAQNFIRAYWLYPKYVKFELERIEPLQS